jgi:hypothetical protein
MLNPAGVKVHLAHGYTDLRKGIDGLGVLVERVLEQDPSGHHAAPSPRPFRRRAPAAPRRRRNRSL